MSRDREVSPQELMGGVFGREVTEFQPNTMVVWKLDRINCLTQDVHYTAKYISPWLELLFLNPADGQCIGFQLTGARLLIELYDACASQPRSVASLVKVAQLLDLSGEGLDDAHTKRVTEAYETAIALAKQHNLIFQDN